MRISDWSSDVCSSDLEHWLLLERRRVGYADRAPFALGADVHEGGARFGGEQVPGLLGRDVAGVAVGGAGFEVCGIAHRSEERRVGKGCVRTCRSLWSPDHEKKK